MPAKRMKIPLFTSNLRKLRVANGLKITELARLADVNARTIADIELARRPGTEVTRRKIVKGLNKHRRDADEREIVFEEVFPAEQARLF